jgi:hypothetical protein
MKWMKVIYTRENMTSQVFQHGTESQLIEVMNMKMHTPQSGLTVNLIPMKWMKVRNSMKNMVSQDQRHLTSQLIVIRRVLH